MSVSYSRQGPNWPARIAWTLLLLSMIPARLLGSWMNAKLSIDMGRLLKTRLLRGALQLDLEVVRRQGVGQLLGRVMETQALEALALNGGLGVLIAVVELGFAAWVLGSGAGGGLHVALLIAWGLYHALYGHRHRLRIGLRTGLIGLFAWSFVMATAHGAGMMLIPVLMPMEPAGEHAHQMPATGSLFIATLAVLVHSLAMLLTTGAVALIVYEWIGLDFLRRGWINLDLLWTAALILMGAWLLLA